MAEKEAYLAGLSTADKLHETGNETKISDGKWRSAKTNILRTKNDKRGL